jgi:hypothetical protein
VAVGTIRVLRLTTFKTSGVQGSHTSRQQR